MKSSTHMTLGNFLSYSYLQDYPLIYRKAFTLGCIQPDKNPTTYLKGSFRWQWFRGHNWENAKKYIHRSSKRLQNRKQLRLLDFYQLGKLIHYIADAFTYAHNKQYNDSLTAHRGYEQDLDASLEHHLLLFGNEVGSEFLSAVSLIDYINVNHKEYMDSIPCLQNDVQYCLKTSAQVLQILLQDKIPHQYRRKISIL